MSPDAIARFARAWIVSQEKWEKLDGLSDDDPDMEIVYDLMRLTEDDWEVATAICVEVAKQSADPMILEILGASPLEDILRAHHDKVLPAFLKAAKENENFRTALGHVWQVCPPDAWMKFARIRDELV
jgi:hypothetical protein